MKKLINKIIIFMLLVMPTAIYAIEDEEAVNFSNTCESFASSIRIFGIGLFIVKILLPLVIIVKASISLINVVITAKEDEFKKNVTKLLHSIIAAVIVFMVPTLLKLSFNFITGYDNNNDSKICVDCLIDPFDSSCTQYIKE